MNFSNQLSFSYGSNLDLTDWQKWCKRNDCDSDSIEMLPGIFILPDYELKFHYFFQLLLTEELNYKLH